METIGQRIRRLRKKLGIPQPELARRCGWDSQARISNYEKDLRTPKPEDTEKLAAQLGTTASYIMFGADASSTDEEGIYPRTPSEKHYALIPQYSTKGACGAGHFNDHIEVIGQRAFRRDQLERLKLTEHTACIIFATGDSMEPTIYEGDELLLDRNQTAPQHGEVYAVMMDGEVRVKRYFREFGINYLRGDNPNKAKSQDAAVPPDQELHIIGRVVWRGGGL